MIRIIILITLCLCFANDSANAQYDSTYFISYEEQIAGRFYISQKYTSFRLNDKQNDIQLRYLPNTTLNLGIGATYKWATLNLAYGFGFLNPERGKGETKYLDLQCHFYGRKWILDFMGQIYNGFYLNDEDLRAMQGSYYVRPDIKVREYGLIGQYILNHEKFSFRAGFLQNEWQKKSAGTILLGWQIVSGSGTADSTIIPRELSSVPAQAGERRLFFFEIGPSAGYAYTLVIKKHFFIMFAATAALSFDYNSIEAGSSITKSTSFLPNFNLKTFAGYNSEKIAVSLTFTNETVNLVSEADQQFSLSTGNLRLNFVKRFPFKGFK